MIYAFGEFELDTAGAELRAANGPVPIEPRVFALLCLLVENRDRVVSRDEAIEKIWDGRIVTDAAISTTVRSIRSALGDDGADPRFLRTVRKRGFRFVAGVRIVAGEPQRLAPSAPQGGEPAPGDPSAPVVAVLPFDRIGNAADHGAISEAVPAEIISSLSRLHWLRVIARASSFRFRGLAPDPDTIRRTLGATYWVSGTIECVAPRLTVTVELNDSRSGDVVWGERYSGPIEDVHAVRAEICQRVVAATDASIPVREADLARHRPPDDLDAWSAYHLGLHHMYRFTRTDTDIAERHFRRALDLDPHFARAHAGLSFTSFLDAFLRYGPDPARRAVEARRHGERGVELDPLDPFANFTFGRALWLEGQPDAGLPWLERATALNPNFAQGFYARAWTDMIANRAAEGREHVDLAMRLSPIDPLLYAMFATRAITHLLDGEPGLAAHWAERAARAPGAHYLINIIAVAAHARNGDELMASRWANAVRRRRPDATAGAFFDAFPFTDPETRRTLAEALAQYGF